MHKYRLISKKGEGTFSEVLKAQSIKNGKYLAIKCMKNHFDSIDQVNNLREIQALRRLSPHHNIIKLYEVLYDQPTGRLALVFELMDMNIYEHIRGRRHYLPEHRVKMYMYQLVKAMDHMHRNGIFHRDVKPENILITDEVLKVADYGSCRGIYSKQPYTEYISTRWYRAPECLLTDGYYGYKMDMWGVGCVMFEVIALFPLFPGTDELDQINKIHNVLGTPPKAILDKFKRYASHMDFNFPQKDGTGIAKMVPHVTPDCVDIISKLLAYDPEDRLSARQALKHEYFKGIAKADAGGEPEKGKRGFAPFNPAGRSSRRKGKHEGNSSKAKPINNSSSKSVGGSSDAVPSKSPSKQKISGIQASSNSNSIISASQQSAEKSGQPKAQAAGQQPGVNSTKSTSTTGQGQTVASNSQYQYSMRNEGGSNIAATGKSSGAAAGGRDEKEETRRHRHRRERDKRRDRREKEKRDRGARREARRREKDRERRAPIPAAHDELSALPPISKNSPTLKIDMAGGGGQSSKHRNNRSKNVARGSHLYGTYGYTGYNSGNYNYNGANNSNGTSYRYQHKSKYYKSGSNYGKNHSQHSYGKGSGTHAKGGAHHVGSRRYPSGKKGNFQGSGASSKFLLSQAQSGVAPAGGGSGHNQYSYGKYGYQFRRSDRSSNKYLSPYSQRALKQHMR